MECGEVDLARLISARQSLPLDMIWVGYYWKQVRLYYILSFASANLRLLCTDVGSSARHP